MLSNGFLRQSCRLRDSGEKRGTAGKAVSENITWRTRTACWTAQATGITLITLTLVDLQLDAQNFDLFMYNIFIKILYLFRALPCSSLGGLRRNCIYAACGIVTVCRELSCAPVKKELLLSQPVHRTVTCRQWRYQRLHIYNYDVDLLKMSRAMLETCTEF
jgi:hypothetical protein